MSEVFTPSTEETVLETPVETPAETPIVETPVETPEQRYEYQPTDDQGRPIGGKQVIKYRTQDELVQKLTHQSVHQIRKMREQERKIRLGILEEDTVGSDAPRQTQPLNLKPKELTPEEKASLAIRMGISPEDFDNTTDELFEIKFGVKPGALASTVAELQQTVFAQQINAEAATFQRKNADYVVCPENGEALAGWLARYNLAPTASNFQRAFDKLKDAGVLYLNETEIPEPVIAPVVETPSPVAETTVPVVETPVVETPAEETVAPPAPPVRSRVPLSLSRSNTDDGGGTPATPGSDITYDIVKGGQKLRLSGLAAINAMPADEYRRRVLSDPNFLKKEQALEQEAASRRSARR